MKLQKKLLVVLLFAFGITAISFFPGRILSASSQNQDNSSLLPTLYQSFTQTALIQTIADALVPFISTPYVYEPVTTHSPSSQKPTTTYVPLQQSSQNQQGTTTTTNPSPASSISSSPIFYSNTSNYTTANTPPSTNNYITKQEFEQRLSQLSSALSSITIPTITTPQSPQPSNNIYQVIAQSSRIDQLSNTSISNPTITGGTITNSTINTPSLNVSGSTNLSTTSITNLYVPGNVGVGTSSPYMKLSVVGDESVSGSLRLGNGKAWGWWPGVALAIDENFNENPINSSLNGLTGFNSIIHLPINPTASHPAGFGVESFVETDANDSANWNILEQFGGYIDHVGSGTVNNARAVDAQVYIDGSGNITNAYAVQAALWDFGSGSYTNAYGVYIDNNNVSATNQYGLFVTGENKNYFSGNVGIGTTSPYAKLSITGSGTDTGAVFQIANSSNVPKITISDNGNIDMGSIMTVIRATSAPSAPTLSVHGTPGTATFGYKIAFKGPGGVSAASAETVITNAPSTLNGTDYISINLPTCPDSFTKVIVYRTTAPAGYHSPWTLGQTSLYGCDTTVNDQGEYANFRVMSDIVDHTAGISMNRLNITNDSSVLYGGSSALLNILGSFVGDDWTKDGYVKMGISTGLSVKPGVYGDIPSAFGIWNTVTDDVTDGPDMANYSNFSLYGGWVDYYGSGTIAKSSGIDASIYNEANGSITNANAADFGVYNYGSGTIQNAYGVRVDSFGGGGPITNAYGVHIANQNAALNNWAVHTDQSASSTCATCSYALYNAGTAPSYFAGNLGLGTTTPTLGRLVVEPGAYVSAGGVWTNASDRNQKENFTVVSPEETLSKINQLPITQWNYKTEDKSVKHIGPVAQDFYSLFGLGNNDTSISTIDPSGVALLGIQALSKRIDSLFSTSTSTSSPLSLIAIGGKDIIDSLGYYSGQIVDGVIHFARVTVDTLTAKSGVFEKIQSGENDTQKLCLGSTCITEAELKTILDKNSITAPSGGSTSSSTDSVQTPTETITEPVASTTSNTVDQSQSTTSPDSITIDSVSSSTTSIQDSVSASSSPIE